jgi:hypothetical protein
LKKSELEKCIVDIWGPVYIKGDLTVTGIEKRKIIVGGKNEPLFGDEILNLLPGMNDEFEVVLDI